MLRITDAQRTKIVSVPAEVAQHIGVFKDMLDTVPTPEGDSEPVLSPAISWVNYQVVLDEKPETFDTFVLWLHHSPDFEVTKGNPPACFTDVFRQRRRVIETFPQIRNPRSCKGCHGTSLHRILIEQVTFEFGE